MMDKLTKCQNLIIRLLEEYVLVKPANIDPHEYPLIADAQRNHFLHYVILHLDIKPDGKIWLSLNNTDWNIVHGLLENDIPKSQIVLVSLHPDMRIHSGYAVTYKPFGN